MTTTTKRSGAINWPVLIIIAIFAGLAAVGLFLGCLLYTSRCV